MQLFQKTIRLLNHNADGNQSDRYYLIPLRIENDCTRLEIRADYSLLPDGEMVQVPFFIFDSKRRVRFMRAANMACSGDVQTITLSKNKTSRGGIPGGIEAGEWLLIAYKRRMAHDFDLKISAEVFCEPNTANYDDVLTQLSECPFSGKTTDEKPGWYSGELHTHSAQSTGYTGIKEIIEEAEKERLDFLAVTDHFTMAHWCELQKQHHSGRPLLMQSAEISGDYGHACVHGLHSWINPLVDDNRTLTSMLGLPDGYSMNDVADEVHRQGGLFCINHPMSGIMGWRYRNFDFSKADLFEIFSAPEKDVTLQNLVMWDRLLLDGYRLTGVASSDSHHPSRPGTWKLGQYVTRVYASSLSSKGITDGLRRGHAYAAAKGCAVEFTAESGGTFAMTGDEIDVPAGGSIHFSVKMNNVPAGNLFIIQDGLILDMVYFGAESRKVHEFALAYDEIRKGGSYVRLEYYEVEGPLKYYGYSNHSWNDMRFLTNPIWIKRGDTL